MKHFLLSLLFVASLGYADSKTDTTIVPKKTGGAVIVNAPSGSINITSGATNGTSGVTITSGSTSGLTLLRGSTVKLQTYSGGWLDRMTILSSGNVGIDNTNPGYKLTVNGIISTDTITEYTSTNGVQLKGRTTSTLPTSTYIGYTILNSGETGILQSGSAVTVLTINIPAGQWYATGSSYPVNSSSFSFNGLTGCGFSTTNNTFDTAQYIGFVQNSGSNSSTQRSTLFYRYIYLDTATNYYLVCQQEGYSSGNYVHRYTTQVRRVN